MILLSRENFKDLVFKRENYKCAVCKFSPCVDAHHIIERRLWDNGGYYLENGVGLCEKCHRLAEENFYSPQDLRNIVGIKHIILPKEFDCSKEYDKWGN